MILNIIAFHWKLSVYHPNLVHKKFSHHSFFPHFLILLSLLPNKLGISIYKAQRNSMNKITWSTRAWSSGEASAPRSRGFIAWKSSSLKLSTLLVENPEKKDTLFLRLSETEEFNGFWFRGQNNKWVLIIIFGFE